ncbi:MAG: hypothetical protein AB7K24_14595 [Gemmataceae bacterium]
MSRARLRDGLAQIGQALREPELFLWRWHTEGAPYGMGVFFALALTAILGTTTYGLAMGILGGPERMLESGLLCTAAAGISWSLPLPALYILNSLSGSKLRASTTFLAALVTTSWGGLALIASIPVTWFMTVSVPVPSVVLLVNLAVFGAVGVAMVDVFCRLLETLEPARGRLPAWWLALVGVIGAELFYAFGLFQFPVV